MASAWRPRAVLTRMARISAISPKLRARTVAQHDDLSQLGGQTTGRLLRQELVLHPRQLRTLRLLPLVQRLGSLRPAQRLIALVDEDGEKVGLKTILELIGVQLVHEDDAVGLLHHVPGQRLIIQVAGRRPNQPHLVALHQGDEGRWLALLGQPHQLVAAPLTQRIFFPGCPYQL
jgi:hypothetical protein